MSAVTSILTVIVLTRDEAIHLPRLLADFEGMSCRFVMVDSGSTDGTVELAQRLGAEVLLHPFENHARQFNWALELLDAEKRLRWVHGRCNMHWLVTAFDAQSPGVTQNRKDRLKSMITKSAISRSSTANGTIPCESMEFMRGYGRISW